MMLLVLMVVKGRWFWGLPTHWWSRIDPVWKWLSDPLPFMKKESRRDERHLSIAKIIIYLLEVLREIYFLLWWRSMDEIKNHHLLIWDKTTVLSVSNEQEPGTMSRDNRKVKQLLGFLNIIQKWVLLICIKTTTHCLTIQFWRNTEEKIRVEKLSITFYKGQKGKQGKKQVKSTVGWNKNSVESDR